MAEDPWQRVDLTPDGRGLVASEGGAIAVFRVDGRLHAVSNACPHEGNPLVDGYVLGTTLVCAFHGWRFDLETGACLLGERPVSLYRVEEREGDVWVCVGPTA